MMRKLLGLTCVLLASTGMAAGQVTLTNPNTASDGYVWLANTSHQIYLTVGNGTTNQITWSVVSGDVTVSSPHNLNLATVTLGPNTGVSCTNDSAGVLTTNKTATVRGTSVDDPTVHQDVLISVCNATGLTMVQPVYRMAYVNQPVDVTAFVLAVDDTGNWAVSGTGCTAPDTNKNDVLVTPATANTICTLTFTSNNDNTKTATAYIDVVGALPAYGPWNLVEGALTESVPCPTSSVPARFTSTRDVGPTQTYHTLQAAFDGTIPAGALVRVHNEDTGTTPTRFHEWIQVNTSGTLTSPIYVCGVPNSLGYLPIIDGDNATGNAGASPGVTAGLGLVTTWPGGYGAGSTYGTYQTGNANPGKPNYITFAGLHLANADPAPTQYYFQMGGSPHLTAITRAAPTGATYNNVTVVTVASPGSGQTNGTYTINGVGGGGTGAQIQVVISGGAIASATISSAGANYTSAPTFTVSAGGTPGTVTAQVAGLVTATLNLSGVFPGFDCNLAYGNQSWSIVLVGVTGSATDFNGPHFLNSCVSNTLTWYQAGAVESGTTSSSSLPMGAWGGSDGFNIRTGSNITIIGNHTEHAANAVATYENQNNGWAGVTTNITIQGNHFESAGVPGDFTEHCMYLQSFWMVIHGNLCDHFTSGALGGWIKFRGAHNISRYNVALGGGDTRGHDFVEDQDSYAFMNWSDYKGNGWPGAGDQLGAAGVTSINQSWGNDFAYGEVCESCANVHYSMDHPAGFNARTGTLWFYNNTWDQLGNLFDTTTGNGYQPLLIPQFWAANNALYTDSSIGVLFISQSPTVATWLTNVAKSGSFIISPSPLGGNYNGGTAHGWAAGCDYVCYVMEPSATIEYLQTGLTSGNFITAATIPYNTTTFIPSGGSPLINAGSALSGQAANLPVRLQYSRSIGGLTPRLNALTVGAVDSGPPPTLTSITVTDNSNAAPLSVVNGATIQAKATANWSDSSTTDVTPTASWSTGSSHFIVSQTAYQNIQKMAAGLFTQCGQSCSAGASNGSPTLANFGITSPSLSGSAVQMITTGINSNFQVFTTALDLSKLPGSVASVTGVVTSVSSYLPSSTSVPEALEGPDVAIYDGTYLLYPSLQCRTGGRDWYVWDGSIDDWQDTHIVCAFTPDTWHSLSLNVTLNHSTPAVTYNSFTVDGTVHTLGLTYGGISFSSPPAMKAQLQTDGALSGTPATTTYHDNWSVIATPGVAGLVSGLSIGSGTLTANYLSVNGTATVNVISPPTRARLGGTKRIGATVSR